MKDGREVPYLDYLHTKRTCYQPSSAPGVWILKCVDERGRSTVHIQVQISC